MCIYVSLSEIYIYFFVIFPFSHFIFNSTTVLSSSLVIPSSLGRPGVTPPDVVVSGDNVTLPSSFVAREANNDELFPLPLMFDHTYSLFRFRFSFYFHSTKY